jgi:hypothetical protein
VALLEENKRNEILGSDEKEGPLLGGDSSMRPWKYNIGDTPILRCPLHPTANTLEHKYLSETGEGVYQAGPIGGDSINPFWVGRVTLRKWYGLLMGVSSL